MAHPERKEWAKDLSQKLQVPIVYDRKNDIWDTCRRAWLAIDKNAEYGLVLQDDAILCTDFRKHAEAVLQEDFVYSLYAGNLLSNRIRMAERKGRDYVITEMVYNEVALCMRTEHIGAMIQYCDEREATTDQEIGRWAKLNRIKIYHPLPSLVDHRDTESIFRRNYNRMQPPTPRRAVRFKG